jgi:hypothetical protein
MNFRASKRSDLPTSRPVRETLAFDTLHGKNRTFSIAVTEFDAIAVAKIKLCVSIGVQI